MPRLTRVNQKVFASNSGNNGVFGSAQSGNPQTSDNVATLQSLPAFLEGWDSAAYSGEKLPPLEELQGIQYGISYQQAYMLQEGIAEWNADTTYYKGSFCKTISGSSFKLYCSLLDNNLNKVTTNTDYWKKVMDSDDLYVLESTLNTRVPPSVGSSSNPVYVNSSGVITACSKQDIVGLGMPDYESGFTVNSGYVATQNCIGYCCSTWDSTLANVKVNGVDVFVYRSGQYGKFASSQFFVPKGATVTFSGGFSQAPILYPCIGG